MKRMGAPRRFHGRYWLRPEIENNRVVALWGPWHSRHYSSEINRSIAAQFIQGHEHMWLNYPWNRWGVATTREAPYVARGLGDWLASFFRYTGVTYVVEKWSAWTGRECKCEQRKATLNRWWWAVTGWIWFWAL